MRPIAVGEVLVRVAGKLAFDLICNEAMDLFGSVQLGCGAPGGAQVAASIVTFTSRSDGPLLTILRDLSNAFNEVARRIILEWLFNQQPLQRVFRLAH